MTTLTMNPNPHPNPHPPGRPRGAEAMGTCRGQNEPAQQVIQINLNNSPKALDMLRVTAAQKGATTAIISEPPRNISGGRWYASEDAKAAIIIYDGKVPARLAGRGNGWVAVWIGDTEYISCYFSPNKTTQEFMMYLADIERHILARGGAGARRDPTGHKIMGGDLNAWSPEWGSNKEDARGRHLKRLMKELGLKACNVGNTPTFQKGGRSSRVDVTFATSDIHEQIWSQWSVDDDTESLSDHNYITYKEPGKAV